MGWLIAAAACWAIFWSSASSAVTGFMAFALFVMGWGVLALVLWFAHWRKTKRRKTHASALAEAGVKRGAGFDHVEDGTGLAINPGAKTLTLHVGGHWKTYLYEDVRAWEANKVRAGHVYATGVQGAMVAAGANMRAARDAANATGFFVTVRDAQHPKWRIAMKSEATQARWVEILRQEINEGGLAGKAA